MAAAAASSASEPAFLLLAQRVAVSMASLERTLFTEGGNELLGVLFSCRLAGCLSQQVRESMLSTMKEVGAKLDSQAPGGLPKASKKDLPHLTMLDFSDRSVLFKPAGWEVYGQHVEKQLSDFVLAALGDAPIFHDPKHQHGFLHRLDVPSSRLVLVAKSYKAFYDLQCQLHTGDILRDYKVLCHGKLSARRREIRAQLTPDERGPTMAGRGKASSSKIFLERWIDCSIGALSQAQLSIATGRKHQIRSHLAHVGHPIVRDRLYSSRPTFQSDARIAERNWLHRNRLVFGDLFGDRHEVHSDLPKDLQVPKKGAVWRADRAPGDDREEWLPRLPAAPLGSRLSASAE